MTSFYIRMRRNLSQTHPEQRYNFSVELIVIFFTLLCGVCRALPPETNTRDSIYTTQGDALINQCNFDNIRTIQLYPEGSPMAFPLLELGGGYNLELHFDDLDAAYQDYSYRFVHCTADWKPSGLMADEFMTGFSDNPIMNYRPSFNTLRTYTHYSLRLPNNDVQFTISGNYIIKVYLRNDPEQVVFTRRFLVLDRKLTIKPDLKRASRLDDMNYKQEIDFEVYRGNYRIEDPYGALKTVILQNSRWDNAKTDMKPLFVKDDVLIFDDALDNVFPGGNEFRFFDVKSTRYWSERIKNITSDSSGFHITLLNDEKRSFKRYYSYSDLNGSRLIAVQEGRDPETDADYVGVTFTLPMAHPVNGGDLFIFGALSDWQCKEQFRMHFDKERLAYKAKLNLKQGYYNYSYAFLEKGFTEADLTLIEGTHSETENDYIILIYDHPFGSDYDHLIGFLQFNSMNKL